MGGSSGATLSLLFSAALCLEAARISVSVHHPPGRTNWTEARRYCKTHHIDLVTRSVVNKVWLSSWLMGINEKEVWVGLRRDADSSWKWIDGEAVSGVHPLQSSDRCGSFVANSGTWQSRACTQELQAICYRDNLVVVKQNKTWEQALRYCRTLTGARHRILTMHNMRDGDYDYVRRRIYRATTDEVWVSLRFLAGEWRWMNGAKPDDQMQLPQCPSQGTHCGTLSKTHSDKWITRDCSERRNFICQRMEKNLNEQREISSFDASL